jgi:hypothetical protein
LSPQLSPAAELTVAWLQATVGAIGSGKDRFRLRIQPVDATTW